MKSHLNNLWLKFVPQPITDFGQKYERIPFTKGIPNDGYVYCDNQITDCKNALINTDNCTLIVDPLLYPVQYENWQGKFTLYSTIGWLDFPAMEPYGIWSADIKCNKDSFCAFWMVREPHTRPENSTVALVDYIEGDKIFIKDLPFYVDVNWFVSYDNINTTIIECGNDIMLGQYAKEGQKYIIVKDLQKPKSNTPVLLSRPNIKPEVDIMEFVNGKVKHSIHYGYPFLGYNMYSETTNSIKSDNKWHNYAVRILPDRYEFFVDYRKRFIVDIKESLSNAKVKPIFNIASHGTGTNYMEMEIKDFRYWKWEK